MLAAVGAALALAFVVWVWGGVAGALFGQGWPSVGSGQLPSIVARLPGRLSDPSHAWPGEARGDLPGPWGFYAALALVACGSTATPTPASKGAAPKPAAGGKPVAKSYSAPPAMTIEDRWLHVRRVPRHVDPAV